MPTPCREQVVAAVATTLAGIAGIDGLVVERDRIEPLEDGDMPRLVIYEGAEELVTVYTGEDAYELLVFVQGFAAGDTTSAALAALAELRAAVDAALLADRTLGGLVRDLAPADEEAPQRLDYESARPAKDFVRGYRVAYATREGDPYTFA